MELCVEFFKGFFHIRHRFFHSAKQYSTLCTVIKWKWYNQTHRLAALAGLTPNEVTAQVTLRLLQASYQRHQARSLPQNKGFVSFIRLVRKSGRITLGTGDRFMVDPDLAYTYVLARVDLAEKTVVISQDDEALKAYDYSADTVGTWAGDDGDAFP